MRSKRVEVRFAGLVDGDLQVEVSSCSSGTEKGIGLTNLAGQGQGVAFKAAGALNRHVFPWDLVNEKSYSGWDVVPFLCPQSEPASIETDGHGRTGRLRPWILCCFVQVHYL